MNPKTLLWTQVLASYGFGGKEKGWALPECSCMSAGWRVTMLYFKIIKPLCAWAYKKIFGADKCSTHLPSFHVY